MRLHLIFCSPDFDTDRTIIDLDDAKALLSHQHFRPSKVTTFFIHGFQSSVESITVRNTTNAYLTNGSFNIVALSWGPLATESYPTSVANTVRVGDRMTDVLIALSVAGLNLGKVHLVGHSLGGQMCGMIGDGVKKKTKNALNVDRITALDPAGPLFYHLLPIVPVAVRQITAGDASFVDVIHTDAGFLGDVNSCGQIDFWPNSGTRLAPGCPVLSGIFLATDCEKDRFCGL